MNDQQELQGGPMHGSMAIVGEAGEIHIGSARFTFDAGHYEPEGDGRAYWIEANS